ncbi:MAG: TetR/AcrR family transcriptional regulator [Flavobacteriaceae bacterium]|nr:TetR/AcrR family transcriptional regulator [Flavobacteriaceae bacterium]
MPVSKTKKKIILAAVELFNESGIHSVRNQDIAKKSGISLSNFNYHYATKKDLVKAIFDYMTEVLVEDVYGNQTFIIEGEGLNITKSFFVFQEQFCFFFLDTPNILKFYPEISKLLEEQITEAFKMIKGVNYLAIGMGYMKPEPEDFPGLYDELAAHLWRNTHFWISYSRIKNFKDNIVLKGMEANYSLMYPYLTEKGIEANQRFLEKLKEETSADREEP